MINIDKPSNLGPPYQATLQNIDRRDPLWNIGYTVYLVSHLGEL
jgi:hypothetical protein